MFHFYTHRGYSSGTLVENALIIIFVKRSDYIIIYETTLYLNYRMIIKLRGDKSSYKNAVLRNSNRWNSGQDQYFSASSHRKFFDSKGDSFIQVFLILEIKFPLPFANQIC